MKEKDDKFILCKITSLLFMVTLACHFLIPSQAFAKNKFEKRIPISININTNAAYESGCHKVVGYFKANIRGTADLIEEKGEFLRYSSENLTTSYEFKEDHIEMCDNRCLGKIVEQRSGSGSAKFKNFILDIFLGQTGRFAWIASQGKAPTPEELKIPKDVYQVWMDAEGRFTIKKKPDNGCEPVNRVSGSFPIAFIVGIAEIKPWGSTGSYTWQGDTVYKDEKVSLRVVYPAPSPLFGAQYQVSWTFGEVKPIVRIYREDKDITDKEFEDVIVGKKVKLKAKVFPEGYGSPQGKWEIGGKIVSGWYADASGATLKPFKDYDKPEIEYFWVDGEFTGGPQTVKYSGQVNGKDVSAKTTFDVFKPKIKSEKVEPAKMITIGVMPDKTCDVYPGNIISYKKGTPGIIISHEIEMPPMNGETQHLLQHVQLVKGDTLLHHNLDYSRKSNDQWCLDTEYPYNGRAPYKIEMEDTPSSELGKLTKECHVQDDYLTYLMFIPSSNPKDENAIWIPLRLIKWEWAVGVKKGKDLPLDAPCDKTTYKPIYEVPPRVKGKENISVHPEWSCNIDPKKDKDKKGSKFEIIGYQGYADDKWKSLTAERVKRWGGK